MTDGWDVRRLVVGTDFTPSGRRAVAFAAAFAARLGAEMHLVHVHSLHEHHPLQRIMQGLREWGEAEAAVRAHLQELLEEARRVAARTVRVEASYREDEDVATGLLAAVREQEAGVLVVGRRHHRAFPSGSLAVRLAGEATAAVLVVPEARGSTRAPEARGSTRAPEARGSTRAPEGREGAPPPESPRHLVVPVDFSDASKAAVTRARALAGRLGAELTLLYVAERHLVPVFSDTGLFAVDVLEPDPEITAHAGEALVQLFGMTPGPEVSVRYQVRRGDAASEILAGVEELRADLLVLATYGMTRPEGPGVAGVAEKLLRRSPVPALAFRP